MSPAAVGMMIVVTTVVLAVKKCPYGGIQSAFCYFPIYHEGKIESFHWALEVWLVKAKAEIQINDGVVPRSWPNFVEAPKCLFLPRSINPPCICKNVSITAPSVSKNDLYPTQKRRSGYDFFFYNLGNFLEASFSQEIELRKFKVELKYGTPIFYLPLAFTGRIQSISIFYDVDKVEQVE